MGYNAARIVALPVARLSLSVCAAGCYTLRVAALGQGATMFFTRIGAPECLIILVVLLIVAGLAFRGGFFRGRRRQ